jgi:hypothetical protein
MLRRTVGALRISKTLTFRSATTFPRMSFRIAGKPVSWAIGECHDTARDLDMTAYVLARSAYSTLDEVCVCCGQVRHKCVTPLYDGC